MATCAGSWQWTGSYTKRISRSEITRGFDGKYASGLAQSGKMDATADANYRPGRVFRNNRRGGVEPDLRVPRTEKDVFLGKDPQMDRALELLRSPAAASAGSAAR